MSFFTDNINQSQVIAAIESCGLSVSDNTDVKSLVWMLGNTYAERDYNECEILDVEHKFENSLCAGMIDVRLRVKKPKYLPKESFGKILQVDWKTTNTSTFDSEWKKRYVKSWQWKIYSEYGPGDYFEYRAISKGSGDTKEILLEASKDCFPVLEHLIGVQEMRNALTLSDYTNWPKHQPFACKAYGRDCPYLEICENNNNFEFKTPKEFKVLHYTSSETFLLCPERYRLTEILTGDIGLDSESTSETAIGSAVHKGMEEIYKQLKEKQNREDIG